MRDYLLKSLFVPISIVCSVSPVLASEQGAIVVPFRRFEGSNHMMVPATINGVKTRMLFDTGAQTTFMKRSFLESRGIKVDYTGKTKRQRGVAGEVSCRVALARIEIGSLSQTVPVSVEQDSKKVSGPPQTFQDQPVLGQNFFCDLTFQIDAKKQLIRFRKRSSASTTASKKHTRYTRPAAGEAPFFRDGNNIVVTARVNGRECDMVFDTGADQVVFSDRHLARLGINRPASARAFGKTRSIGGQTRGFTFLIKKLRLGPIEKRNVEASLLIDSRVSRPLLGQTFLKGLNYTIDPVRNVIRFDY